MMNFVAPGFFQLFHFWVLFSIYFFFRFVTQKRVAAPTQKFLFVFSQLLFDIPHHFVALAWYKRSKRAAAKHSQRQWAQPRAKRATSGAASVGGPGIPIQSCINCTKSKSNEIISEIRDKKSRAIAYNIYVYIQYLIMHNFSAAGLPQRRQGRRWLQATAPTATPTPTRLRLWMCLCECALLILIALRMGAPGLTEGSIMTVPLLLCIITRIGLAGERGEGTQGWAMMMGRRVLIIRFDNIMIVLLSELYRLYLEQFQIVKWRRWTGAERQRKSKKKRQQGSTKV